MNSLKILFRNLPFGYVAIIIVIIAIIGMSPHHLITQFLEKPLSASAQNLRLSFPWVIFFIHSIKALATIILYTLLDRHWKLKSYLSKTLVFTLLLAIINENLLRRFLMDMIADHRNMGYELFLVAIPVYISYLFVAVTVVVFSSFKKIWLWNYIVAFLLLTLEYHYIESISHSILNSFFPLTAGGYFTEGAYHQLSILISIYATYIFPVIGMLITYLWIRESFPQSAGMRGLLYFLLLIGVHGQLLGILQIAVSQGNIFYRILYYGSFWWELLIVSYTIVLFTERKSIQKFYHTKI